MSTTTRPPAVRTAPAFRFRWYGWCGLATALLAPVGAIFCGWTPQILAVTGGGLALALAALLYACLRTCWLKR